jgi:hypothetical protein
MTALVLQKADFLALYRHLLRLIRKFPQNDTLIIRDTAFDASRPLVYDLRGESGLIRRGILWAVSAHALHEIS